MRNLIKCMERLISTVLTTRAIMITGMLKKVDRTGESLKMRSTNKLFKNPAAISATARNSTNKTSTKQWSLTRNFHNLYPTLNSETTMLKCVINWPIVTWNMSDF